MASSQIQDERIQPLNTKPERKGDYVLYWMQQSQRAESNHAFEYAVQVANELVQPLVVVFGLMDDYPGANLRHYAFMLEGLAETAAAAENRGAGFILERGHPVDVAVHHAARACFVVCDRGYLRHQRQWRRQFAGRVKCRTVQVESDAVVPVRAVSRKQEFAARTIRPKIHGQLERFLIIPQATPLEKDGTDIVQSPEKFADPEALLARLKLDRSVERVDWIRGGLSQARARLNDFVQHRLHGYKSNRRRLVDPAVSWLSPYLHFGQISSIDVALAAREARDIPDEDRDAFLEELIVRRELAFNYVNYQENYDKYSSLPEWARRTLSAHRNDLRPRTYTRRELEDAQTHDPYWNASMHAMRRQGYLHNYLRMYWGKKILEWSKTPEYAFQTALYLNNKYFLDGRDPASFANVGWLFGLHDRPWPERPVFGTVRTMSEGGLRSKTDIEDYARRMEEDDLFSGSAG